MAQRLAVNATDPSVDGRLIAWHEAGQPGVLVRDGQQVRLNGVHPALGEGRLAIITGAGIEVQSTSGDGFGMAVQAPADAVAVSGSCGRSRGRRRARPAAPGGRAPARA